jgi:hypothetical protein
MENGVIAELDPTEIERITLAIEAENAAEVYWVILIV